MIARRIHADIHRRNGLAAGVALFLLLASGCNAPPDDSSLFAAWEHCEALDYETAYPLVRAYLLRHPRDPVAHYLLGKYYLHLETPALTLAKGQLDMARSLFDTDGDLSILAPIMTAAQFQATLHCDTALALMRTVLEADKAGMPQHVSVPVLRTALDHARKGMYHDPESEFLRELVFSLEMMVGESDNDREAPSPTPFTHPDSFLLT